MKIQHSVFGGGGLTYIQMGECPDEVTVLIVVYDLQPRVDESPSSTEHGQGHGVSPVKAVAMASPHRMSRSGREVVMPSRYLR